MISSYFIGAAVMVAPFFIKLSSKSMPTLSQTFLLHVTAFFGVMFFGLDLPNKRVAVAAALCVALTFMAQETFGVFQLYQLGSVMAGVAFIALACDAAKKRNFSFIYSALAAVCLLESGWVFLNAFGYDPYFEWLKMAGNNVQKISKHAPSWDIIKGMSLPGSLGNPNHSMALIAATVPFVKPILWAIPFVAMLITRNAMPTICLGVSLVVLYSYKNRAKWPLFAGGAVLASLAAALVSGAFGKGSFLFDNGRLKAWSTAINMTGFQITGKGLGWVSTEFSQLYQAKETFMQLHNEWLELYVAGGILAVMVATWLVLPVFKHRGFPAVNACLISLLVNSLGNFTFHIAPLFMVFGVCYAIQLTGRKPNGSVSI